MSDANSQGRNRCVEMFFRLEPVMHFERDAALRAKGPAQASPGQARDERRPGSCGKKEQCPEGAPHGVTPLQGVVHFLDRSQGGVRVRRGLALGWLVKGLWPTARRLGQSA